MVFPFLESLEWQERLLAAGDVVKIAPLMVLLLLPKNSSPTTLQTLNMPLHGYSEDDVAEAILETTDNGLSLTQAAQKWGIPKQTLSDRLKGRKSVQEVQQPAQHLSQHQEERLEMWVLRQEALGYAPSHGQLRACAVSLLKEQGTSAPVLGKNWVTRFLRRHKELKTKLGRRQEASRFDSFTPKAVN